MSFIRKKVTVTFLTSLPLINLVVYVFVSQESYHYPMTTAAPNIAFIKFPNHIILNI